MAHGGFHETSGFLVMPDGSWVWLESEPSNLRGGTWTLFNSSSPGLRRAKVFGQNSGDSLPGFIQTPIGGGPPEGSFTPVIPGVGESQQNFGNPTPGIPRVGASGLTNRDPTDVFGTPDFNDRGWLNLVADAIKKTVQWIIGHHELALGLLAAWAQAKRDTRSQGFVDEAVGIAAEDRERFIRMQDELLGRDISAERPDLSSVFSDPSNPFNSSIPSATLPDPGTAVGTNTTTIPSHFLPPDNGTSTVIPSANPGQGPDDEVLKFLISTTTAIPSALPVPGFPGVGGLDDPDRFRRVRRR